MKKIAVVFVLILAFCGCENSSEPSLEERFSCKVDGKLFVAQPDDNSILGKRNLSIYYYNTGENPSYLLSIGAGSADKVSISIGCDTVTNLNKPYELRGSLLDANGTVHNSISGTLKVSQLEGGKIVGIFNFTAKERGGTKIIKITDGKFNAAFISR